MSGKDSLTANAAACVTGVPLKQVHRIIDAGFLGDAATSRKGSRLVLRKSLVALKLAHETTGVLTAEGRRRLVRQVLDRPDARTIRENNVSVDLRAMKSEVRRALARLDKAARMIASDGDVLGGAPCFKGMRIPVHDIAEMIANGDTPDAIRAAYPTLTNERIEAAVLYARAHPRRGRPQRARLWRPQPISSSETARQELPQAS